jgi:methylthioribulose 1-phosphate dehydratase/enolase-phosphatase E1
MSQLGINPSRPPAPLKRAAAITANGHSSSTAADGNGHSAADALPHKRAKVGPHKKLPVALVLDIEGTVAPISFVADVMFPYARDNVRLHLEDSYRSEETQEDIEAIRTQAAADGKHDSIPGPSAGKGEVIEAVVAWVKEAIAADRKVRREIGLKGAMGVTTWLAGRA